MKKILAAIASSIIVLVSSQDAMAQNSTITGVESIANHFNQLSEADVNINYFQKLRNTMQGDVAYLEKQVETASAAEKTKLQSIIKRQNAVISKVNKAMNDNKSLNKKTLIDFIDEFKAIK